MFSDAIKKMALRQLSEWMQKEGITEVKIFPTPDGKDIHLEEARAPHRFIHTAEIDRELEKYRAEFSRLREVIRANEDELFTLRNQLAKAKK